MRRFFVDAAQIQGDSINITVKSDVNHIVKVLRMDIDDKLLISDKKSYEYTCSIAEIRKNEIITKIIDRNEFSGEPELTITLYQGIPKSSKMDTIIQKSIELGANQIIPFVSSRTATTKIGDISKSKLDRWRRISDETVKQCRRGIIPEISDPISIKEISNDIEKYDLLIVLYELEETLSLKEALTHYKNHSNTIDNFPKIALVVGPEGGIDDEDVQAMVSEGATAVTVGNRILRTETAGPAAIAMLFYEFEL